MADFIIKNVRASFPVLAEPQEFKAGDGKPRWSLTLLVEPGSAADKAIQEEIKKEAAAVFGEKAAAMLKSMSGQGNKYCYLSGDTKQYDGYEGMMALTCHRAAKLKNGADNTPPLLIDRDPKVNVKASAIYGGCFVNAKVSIYVQKGENPGVRASFSTVQFARDGDAFSSSTPTIDGFDELGDDADAGMV